MRDVKAAQAGVPANDRVKRMGGRAQARYLGTIVRDNDALVRLARYGLYRRRFDLNGAIRVLERRTTALTRDQCCGKVRRDKACEVCRDGYANPNERAMKLRRVGQRRAMLAEVERRITEKEYRLLPGGRRLANTRHHLDKAGLTEAEWRAEWESARFYLSSVGNAGMPGGNPCITLDEQGRLTLSVPKPVVSSLGVNTRVTLTHRVLFKHHSEELRDRVAARHATRFRIEREVDHRGRVRWYLRVEWAISPEPAPSRASACSGGVLGVDLNADHLAAHHLDPQGNPVSVPHRIDLDLAGLSAKARDGRLREAITRLLDLATAAGVQAVAVEDLGFAAEEKSRERYGRRKRFRATISGFPTTMFKTRLVSMAARRGIAVIAVDPRYTSVVGGRDWTPRLSAKHRSATRHDGAAVAIGRRGLAHPLQAHRKRWADGGRPDPHQRMEARPSTARAGSDTRPQTRGGKPASRTVPAQAPAPPPHTRPNRSDVVARPGGRTSRDIPAYRRRREDTNPAPPPMEAARGLE
jgi:IS605 OrfB family transposase